MTCQCQCEHCNPDFEPYVAIGVDGDECEFDSVSQAAVAQLSACRGMTILNEELNALLEHGEIADGTHSKLASLLSFIADEQAENLEALVQRAVDEGEVGEDV